VRKLYRFATLVLVLALLVGCSSVSNQIFTSQTFAMHYWGEEDGEILDKAIQSFVSINGSVIYLEGSETVSKPLADQLAAGLGPDVIIGLPYEEIIPLAEEGLIRDISQYNIEFDAYLPEHLQALTYQGKLYGLPFMGSTLVLFYNKDMVTTPANTVTDLLDGIEEGDSVAIPADFTSLYWGITAFGERPFVPEDEDSEDEGENRSERYTNWFNWLKAAQAQTGVLIDNDSELLYDKFVKGEVAYLIAPIDHYRQFEADLGTEKLGVTLLPGVEYTPDPDKPETTLVQHAGPLFSMQTIVFSQAADEEAMATALELAAFLNNPTMQRKLVLENVERLPTNLTVFISPNLSEIGNVLVRQSRTSVTVPLDRLAEFDSVGHDANVLYLGLLEGGVSPEETTEGFIQLLDSFAGAQ
jgi:maltose-binding protein MalE